MNGTGNHDIKQYQLDWDEKISHVLSSMQNPHLKNNSSIKWGDCWGGRGEGESRR
jgi:hypothetical protein